MSGQAVHAGGFQSATVTIDGLTCSMCSKSVEKSIRKLDFIADVDMDLNANKAYITFLPGEEISFHQIAKKIKQSGFSVREMLIKAEISQLNIQNGAIHQLQQSVFCMVDVEEKRAKGQVEFQIIGEEFLPHKDWKKWSRLCKDELETEAVALHPQASEYYFVTL